MTTHKGKTIAQINGFDIIECEECGFTHCFPLPTPERLRMIYTDDYYTSVKPAYIETVEKDRKWHERIFSHRLKKLESLVNGKRLIEVGSGPGFFLEIAQKRGWSAKGFEPNKDAWLYSSTRLGLDVENSFFGPDRAQGKYDAAYLGLVLEHIPDPLRLLQDLHEVISDGGALCVACPNDFSRLQHAVLQKNPHHTPWWISPPHHINYFNFTSLVALLQKAGFSVVHQEATFPMELFLLLGKDYTLNPSLGRHCHGLRMRIEEELEIAGLGRLLEDMYALFSTYGIGRECVIYAKTMGLSQ